MKRSAFVCLLATTLLIRTVCGQSFTATISGTVKDPSGAVLPGVEITASNSATAFSRTVITNERGEFVLPLLPVGTYQVKAELPGFKTGIREGVLLQVDQRVAVNFDLQIGELTEKLVVNEAVPLVQSETSSIGNVIENRRVVELPLNGREFQNLALLVPGAMSPAQGSNLGFRGGITVAGAREDQTSFTLDGVDMVNGLMRMVSFKPSVDAIQEFKVETSSYSAEYGRTAGGQVTVTTKSGTNDLHGTLFEFLRNDKLDAKNFFDDPTRPIPGFKRNNFGGTLGGPIRKDRTFFFVNYEGLRLRQAITKTASVPTPAMVLGDFSGVPGTIRDPLTQTPFSGNIIPPDRIDSIGQAIARFYPKPNLNDPIRNFVSSPTDKREVDQFTVRIDHKLSDTNSFFGRLSYNHDNEDDPFDLFSGITNLPGYGRLDYQRAMSISLVDTNVFSSALVSEFRIGYNRYSQLRVQEDHTDNIPAMLGIKGTSTNPLDFGYPSVLVTGFDSIGKTNTPTDRSDNTYQLAGSLTYTHSAHTIKFGADAEQFGSNRLNNGSGRGVFNFSGQYSGNPMADLLLGYPRQTQRTLGDSRNPQFSTSFSAFLQDDWRVTSRLTLNLGLRYDFATPMITTDNRLSRYNPATNAMEIAGQPSIRRDISRPENTIPELAALAQTVNLVNLGRRNLYFTDKANFAPRLGLAYRMLGNDRLVLRSGGGIFYNQMSLTNASQGWTNYPFRVGQTFNANATVPNVHIGDPFPGALATSTISPSSIDTHYPTGYVGQYNFGIQYQPLRDLLVDIGYVGSKSTNLTRSRNINQPPPSQTGSVASRRPHPGYGNISFQEPTANANFNSMQLRIEKRYTQGLTLLGSYTWSKSIDDSSGGSASDGDGAVQNNYDLRHDSRGLSAFDARHRLAVSYVVELPIGHNRRFFGGISGVPGWIVSGWELSGITTHQSGRPFTIKISSDNSNTGSSGSDRPNLVGNPNLSSGERSINRWFNTAAFATPPKGTFGNLGRNTMIGPGLDTSDLSLIKNSRFREGKANVQFRAEVFNIFNHPNFDFPNSDLSSPRFGQIFSAEFSRQIQLGLKFVY